MVREYAKYLGIALVLTGIVGIVLGDQSLGGLLNIDIVEDIIHIGSGALLAYVGFRGSTDLARTVVGGTGVVYLLVGLIGFVAPNLFGLLPHGYSIADNLLHLALGVAGIVIAWFVGRDRRVTA